MYLLFRCRQPVGALNPTRKSFFEERYNSWEHDQIPPFHYGTHYGLVRLRSGWGGAR